MKSKKSRKSEDQGNTKLDEQLGELDHPKADEAFDAWLEGMVRLRFLELCFEEIRGRERRAILAETIQRWLDESEKRGLRKGVKAMQNLLLELLSQRFQTLPDQVARRIRKTGSVAELTELGHKVLVVESPADLWQ